MIQWFYRRRVVAEVLYRMPLWCIRKLTSSTIPEQKPVPRSYQSPSLSSYTLTLFFSLGACGPEAMLPSAPPLQRYRIPFELPGCRLLLLCYECVRIDARCALDTVIACLRERRWEDGATMSRLTRQGREVLYNIANECV